MQSRSCLNNLQASIQHSKFDSDKNKEETNTYDEKERKTKANTKKSSLQQQMGKQELMRGTQATQILPTNVKNGISIIWSDWFLEDHEFVEIWQRILEKMPIVQMIKSAVGQLCIIEHLK